MDKQSENTGFLGSKFENFQYQPKADLWDRIQENANTHVAIGPLSAQFENFTYYPHKRVWKAIAVELFPQRKKNILYWSYSAAASIVLLIGTYFFFQNYEINKIIPPNRTNESIIAAHQEQNTETLNYNTGTNSHIPNNTSQNKEASFIDANDSKNNIFLTQVDKTHNNDVLEIMVAEDDAFKKVSLFGKLASLTAQIRSIDNDIYFLDKIAFLNIPFKQNYRSNSIDLKGQLASNLSLLTSQKDYEASPTEYGVSYSSFNVNADGIGSLERENYYENKEHKPPFIFGLMFNYQLSKRFSLSSGLNYIRLSTLASNEGVDWRSEYQTTKHYLGLPVNINYDFVQRKNFNLFITSGIQFEKGIIDKNRSTKFQNGEQINEYFSSDAIKGGQAGFNFGFGTNYHINKSFDLYLQTGITHYFYKSHYNIWSDREIWPNLQAGVRFHL